MWKTLSLIRRPDIPLVRSYAIGQSIYMQTAKDILDLWNHEKLAFQSREIGGLQSFVRKVLECSEIFGLKEGKESTKHARRKNEFIIEGKKGRRRADFVVFLHGEDIVIPVEVERFNNIKAGEYQIATYQEDWSKAYGILTDGLTWRFYNNTRFTEFKIDDLCRAGKFETFWREYTREENYYLTFFEQSGKGALFSSEVSLDVESNRESFFEDTTKLIRHFTDKLGIVGFLEVITQGV